MEILETDAQIFVTSLNKLDNPRARELSAWIASGGLISDIKEYEEMQLILDKIAKCYEGADNILSTKEACQVFLKVQKILKGGA